jgi:hypothetical protein
VQPAAAAARLLRQLPQLAQLMPAMLTAATASFFTVHCSACLTLNLMAELENPSCIVGHLLQTFVANWPWLQLRCLPHWLQQTASSLTIHCPACLTLTADLETPIALSAADV